MSTPETDNPDRPPEPPAARGGLFASRRSLKSPREALQPEAAPPPPPKKKKREGALSAFSGFLSFLLVLCVGAGFGLVALQKKIREPGPLAADKVVYIAPGTDFPDIISQLYSEGVIDSPTLLNAELVIEGARSKLKAGEYLFHQNATMREVLDELVNGRQILHTVTIPEGLTSQQIVDRLRGNEFLLGEARDIPPEGSLLPETYKVPRGYAVSKLLKDMQDSERKLLDQVWARRSPDLPLHSPYELLTLASIVEKETGKADERPRVAGVFVNRLQKHMRLQSDPTIVYGLVGGRGTLGRGILRSEVDKWTPYNTYAVDGLPPGPIANPGRAALEAVANPSRTQDLYFVADGSGGHVFAGSLDEHARNVARWRQIERDAREKGAAADVNRAQPAAAAPAPAAPLKPGQQRSDRGPNAVFGALAAADEATQSFRLAPPSLAPDDAALALAIVRPVMPALEDLEALATYDTAQSAFAGTSVSVGDRRPVTASFTDPGIKVLGVSDEDMLDGPATDGNPDTYPVSPKALAEQRARAAKFGLSPVAGAMPDEPLGRATPVVGAQAADTRRSHAFDASEGTALDPLRNKTWDLNSPKDVPSVMSYH